jgi:hypothetical protein
MSGECPACDRPRSQCGCPRPELPDESFERVIAEGLVGAEFAQTLVQIRRLPLWSAGF